MISDLEKLKLLVAQSFESAFIEHNFLKKLKIDGGVEAERTFTCPSLGMAIKVCVADLDAYDDEDDCD